MKGRLARQRDPPIASQLPCWVHSAFWIYLHLAAFCLHPTSVLFCVLIRIYSSVDCYLSKHITSTCKLDWTYISDLSWHSACFQACPLLYLFSGIYSEMRHDHFHISPDFDSYNLTIWRSLQKLLHTHVLVSKKGTICLVRRTQTNVLSYFKVSPCIFQFTVW